MLGKPHPGIFTIIVHRVVLRSYPPPDVFRLIRGLDRGFIPCPAAWVPLVDRMPIHLTEPQQFLVC